MKTAAPIGFDRMERAPRKAEGCAGALESLPLRESSLVVFVVSDVLRSDSSETELMDSGTPIGLSLSRALRKRFFGAIVDTAIVNGVAEVASSSARLGKM